jgi:uncharacterized membrane protein
MLDQPPGASATGPSRRPWRAAGDENHLPAAVSSIARQTRCLWSVGSRAEQPIFDVGICRTEVGESTVHIDADPERNHWSTNLYIMAGIGI